MKISAHMVLSENLPSVSFSPESGGRVKPRRAIEDISTHGTIRIPTYRVSFSPEYGRGVKPRRAIEDIRIPAYSELLS